jgi:hypothetical protein
LRIARNAHFIGLYLLVRCLNIDHQPCSLQKQSITSVAERCLSFSANQSRSIDDYVERNAQRRYECCETQCDFARIIRR